MHQGYNVVIEDTSGFILLDKVNELDLLNQVLGNIVTTSIIAAEFGKQLPSWVE